MNIQEVINRQIFELEKAQVSIRLDAFPINYEAKIAIAEQIRKLISTANELKEGLNR